MCEGVWVLFEGSELHSLWNSEESVIEFMQESYLVESPEYHYTWIRIEDA